MPTGPFRLSDRLTRVKPSGIRKFFELGKSMKDPIDLSIGQADFDVPPDVKAAAIAAIEQGENRYSVTQGIEPLRQAIRDRYADRGLPLENEDVVVTSGVSGGLLLSFLALLDPGDEVLIPDPYFIMYKQLAGMVGASAVNYNTYPEFKLDPEEIARRITPRTKAIIVNSPSNPTGHAISEDEARAVAAVADDAGIVVISDEIYEDFIYEGRHVSPREFTRNCIVLSGASKNMGMPGWRIGWARLPGDMVPQVCMLQQFSFVCAPVPFQHAALAGINADFSDHREEYRRKRDLVCDGLRENFGVVTPGGAFYAYIELPKGLEMEPFMEACISRQLLVVPGSACSERATHFRLCYAASNEKLNRAVEMLNEIAVSGQ
ncbi:MAG: aminotransferase class I/II-fold pyridoxal phosphate-dependent enzyme [Nitrospira sp.]|nr:aminotransferase class I/II-fold pyridoxal phosphate-dependent enzyme [Nitrospira sp.]